MKFKPSEIQSLLKSTYIKDNYDIGKFKVDRSLSAGRVKVYTIDGSNDVVVVHRGSADYKDWSDNLQWFQYNSLKNSRTYKMHLKNHKKAVEKYGADNIIVMGHSRGGLYAEQLHKDKLAKQVITYNKPLNLYDMTTNLFRGKEEDKNKTEIRTSGDIVSIGAKFSKDTKSNITIPSKTYNPLTEHNTDQLVNLKDDELIGQGIFKKKIDFTKLRKKDLKEFVKNNRKKLNLDINITGLTKKDYVNILEKIL